MTRSSTDHQKGFAAWRKQLPAATAYLVDQVLVTRGFGPVTEHVLVMPPLAPAKS
jgi:hypothetical protein